MENGKVDLMTAKKALEEDGKIRAEKCREEIKTVLIRHKCSMDVSVILSSSRVVPQISIIPLKES